VVSYFNSMAFQALAPETRRRPVAISSNASRAEHGDKRSALLKREACHVMFAKKAATRFAARNWLKTVRALMQFASPRGCSPPIRPLASRTCPGKTDGFRTWNEDDIARFEARHRYRDAGAAGAGLAGPYGTTAAVDVVRMGRQHIPQRHDRSEAAKDRDQAGDPDPSRFASGAGRHPVRTSDLSAPRRSASRSLRRASPTGFGKRATLRACRAERQPMGFRKAACRRLAGT